MSSAPGAAELQLRWFNELSRDEAVGALLLICHSRHWAEQVADTRPYADAEALYKAADEVWMSLAPADWLEALDAHPRIGEGGGKSAKSSKLEQAGMTRADAAVQQAIADGNREYEERFGHIFLISAAGRSAEEILANLRSRLDNDPETEVTVAAEQHRRITRLRIERLLDE
jgi:OHCU decarboxylase